MWMFSLEMLALLKQDCWFELPKITLHGFFEEESTAFKVLYMCAWDLGLLYFYIFNLFFPLGVHLYLAGWRLISSYYLVLPLFKSKASVYVILTPSLIISSFFFFFFWLLFSILQLQSMDFKCGFFSFFLVWSPYLLHFACISVMLFCWLLFTINMCNNYFVVQWGRVLRPFYYLLKFLNTMKYKRCSVSI